MEALVIHAVSTYGDIQESVSASIIQCKHFFWSCSNTAFSDMLFISYIVCVLGAGWGTGEGIHVIQIISCH